LHNNPGFVILVLKGETHMADQSPVTVAAKALAKAEQQLARLNEKREEIVAAATKKANEKTADKITAATAAVTAARTALQNLVK
jgi:F0F1-type ATP synthase membrane subunit b/b'